MEGFVAEVSISHILLCLIQGRSGHSLLTDNRWSLTCCLEKWEASSPFIAWRPLLNEAFETVRLRLRTLSTMGRRGELVRGAAGRTGVRSWMGEWGAPSWPWGNVQQCQLESQLPASTGTGSQATRWELSSTPWTRFRGGGG